ncbi:hypothetical protein [Enterococcus sp.]|uniref:hypothetical protein n=1 Tax=Enterococcus sp. TaxID=35783 RepID=UPI00289AEB20|nr:hypothetical protein [Enterococcus sp.]
MKKTINRFYSVAYLDFSTFDDSNEDLFTISYKHPDDALVDGEGLYLLVGAFDYTFDPFIGDNDSRVINYTFSPVELDELKTALLHFFILRNFCGDDIAVKELNAEMDAKRNSLEAA